MREVTEEKDTDFYPTTEGVGPFLFEERGKDIDRDDMRFIERGHNLTSEFNSHELLNLEKESRLHRKVLGVMGE